MIWRGVKAVWNDVCKVIRWKIGNELSVRFWTGSAYGFAYFTGVTTKL